MSVFWEVVGVSECSFLAVYQAVLVWLDFSRF